MEPSVCSQRGQEIDALLAAADDAGKSQNGKDVQVMVPASQMRSAEPLIIVLSQRALLESSPLDVSLCTHVSEEFQLVLQEECLTQGYQS